MMSYIYKGGVNLVVDSVVDLPLDFVSHFFVRVRMDEILLLKILRMMSYILEKNLTNKYNV